MHLKGPNFCPYCKMLKLMFYIAQPFSVEKEVDENIVLNNNNNISNLTTAA